MSLQAQLPGLRHPRSSLASGTPAPCAEAEQGATSWSPSWETVTLASVKDLLQGPENHGAWKNDRTEEVWHLGVISNAPCDPELTHSGLARPGERGWGRDAAVLAAGTGGGEGRTRAQASSANRASWPCLEGDRWLLQSVAVASGWGRRKGVLQPSPGPGGHGALVPGPLHGQPPRRELIRLRHEAAL